MKRGTGGTMRATTITAFALWGVWGIAQGCVGSIGGPGGEESAFGPGAGDAGEGGVGASSGGGGSAGGAGVAGSADPGNAKGPRFTCSEPETRGQGQLAMRRLTRDELLSSLAAVIGDDVMSASAVSSAAGQIPTEAPGDLVAMFQNGHAFDHVSGMLLTAQAVASEVAASPSARERVLGACAEAADRACADAFLDTTALAIMRRPIADERRSALLAAFDAEGAGLAGMQWLLARTLQAPEAMFHLELPSQVCEAAPQADLDFAWDDDDVFFAPLAGGEVEPPATLTENGWFVWQIPGARVPGSYTKLRIALTAAADDGVPLELDVNLNDAPLMPGVVLEPGAQTIEADVVIESGANVKVGVYFKNAAAGRSLSLETLTLAGDAEATTCSDTPAKDGVYPLDAWSVASRLAYALTGRGPDAALLDAAANDALSTEAQVRSHAERLIATPAARTQLRATLRAWLNLDAIPTPHAAVAERAGIDPEGLSEEAVEELLEYATYQILDRDADTAALMRDAIGFPRSERMAALYGSEVASGDEPVSLPVHGGMLLRIAPLLSGQLSSSPILRGVYVRKRILCDTLPSPDFSIVNARLEELDHQDKTMVTTREAVTTITSVSPCNGCHVSINPIGFALESFDPLGMPRSEELVLDEDGTELARHPIDTHVTGANLESGLPDELDGAADLNGALADSFKVRACIAERLYTQARLRSSAAPDHCALAALEQALMDGGSIKDAWLSAVVGPELFVREASTETSP